MAAEGRLVRWFVEHYLSKQRFDEAVLVMFSVLVVVFVSPFVLVRALSGDWVHAAVDSIAVVVAALNGLYVWRTGRTDIAAPVTAALANGTLIAVVYLFGTETLLWAYPASAATYFLLRPQRAALVNVVILLAIVPPAMDLADWPMVLTFFATLLGVNVLGLVFSASMRYSRSRLRTMAERDALTGARSRHALEPALAAALEQLREHENPASLLVIDLDHFKQVNDTHGHAVGDRVLVEVTTRIDQSIRAGDYLFRYGGEELVVLAHGARSEPAGRMDEKLRERIRREPVQGVGYISVSIGVAEARRGDDPGGWFRRADACLYRAKREGRNCVRVDTAPGATAAAGAGAPA